MNAFTKLKEELVELLRDPLKAEGIRVGTAFPSGRADGRGRRLAVGLGGVELAGGGRMVRLTLRFDLFCPGRDAQGCHAMFEALCAALAGGGCGVGKITCGEISYSREPDGLVCTAQAELAGMLAGAEAEGALCREIVIRRKGVK